MQAPDFSRQRANPQLIEAAMALNENRLHDAEPILRAYLKEDPFDVAAIRMLAELAGRIGRYKDSETLLRRAVELAPNFLAARSNLATVLYRQNKTVEAVAELDGLLAIDPENAANANLKAAALGRIGEYAEAVGLYEQVLKQATNQPKIWMSYGHVLKTVGRQSDSVDAYKKAISLTPNLGEAWWSLANLKTVRFSDDDLTTMAAQIVRSGISSEDRFHLHFALGKAHEDRGEAETSFSHYDEGNRLRRLELPYDRQETSAQVDETIRLFTAEFLASRAGQGCPAADPIFILGMPRAGSTLIEQILSSHSQIEGTMELPDIPTLIGKAKGQHRDLASIPPEALAAYGAEYLKRTRIQRKTDKPFFIDKLPNNWAHVGFIRLILPNAKIIDARRHPLDCCFSNFKQHFARGQAFSYSLADMGHYYRDYVRLMDHFDAAKDGAIHRVIHEQLVDEFEAEVRRLLTYLGVGFEPECLSFHQNERAVQTASSEQVRRPINRDGMGQWRPYADWLGPLQAALGSLIEDYPHHSAA